MSKEPKKQAEERNTEFQHPYNHDGAVPVVKRSVIKEILDNEGDAFKVRLNDGTIAIVQFEE